MENKKTIRLYKTADMIKITAVSEQRLSQLRNGQKSKRTTKKGLVKTGWTEPRLKENEDYEWVGSEIFYLPSAIEKILNRKKRPDLMTRKATETPDSTGTEVEIHEENEG
jgi:hypothetical protein